jgi:biopolymer transport protein ExbB
MLKLILLALLLAQPAVAQTATPTPAAGTPQLGGWRMDVPPPERMPVTDPPAGAATGVLPHGLSPWGMFLSADIVVQAVMVGLALASLLTWTIWFAKALQLGAARRRAAAAAVVLTDATSLTEASRSLNGRRGAGPALLRAAEQELETSADIPTGGIQERVASRLERSEAAASREMQSGMNLLATIGSTAPFVGLFGTVWGIMNAFVGIAEAQTTNLAVVAPGIAEALLATALGLVAAIPAVVCYNRLARGLQGYRVSLRDAGAAIERLVSRDLDRARLHRLRSAA